MDCLVCHDTTGTYKKIPTGAGMPDESVDLKKVAENVGHTSRQTCGSCHFSGGGGDAIKHADLSGQLLTPERAYDVHMGGYDFTCTECHRTRDHRISGRSSSVPVVEGIVTCRDCHSDAPHYKNELLKHHLNTHGESLACNTCHSPVYAKNKPTQTWWDWSKAGDQKRKPKKDGYGQPDYHWKKGEFRWEATVKPEYAWFNGYMDRILLGDSVDIQTAPVHIARPVGSIKDPDSRITPFKIMKGVQAVDAENKYFLVPHLFPRDAADTTAYWKSLDWQKAFQEGMATANLDYSGKYQWIETWMYWRLEHEVMPAAGALTCGQCHDSLRQKGKTCNRCHQDSRDVDFDEIAAEKPEIESLKDQEKAAALLRDTTDYIDFKKLGYRGDPIIYGGRFKKLPLGEETRSVSPLP